MAEMANGDDENGDQRLVALFLTGLVAGMLQRPDIATSLRSFSVMATGDRPDLVLHFPDSGNTYHIGVSPCGRMDEAAARRLLAPIG